MDVEYFRHLDYRNLKKQTWEELKYNYNKEDMEYFIENPSEYPSDYVLPILNFPPEPEEVEIFPYTIEEIEYMEEKISYVFPRAFKELLYLFGGHIFTNSFIRNKTIENYSIENDIRVIQEMQEILKCGTRFVQKDLFLVNYSDYFRSCVISNKYENPPVYEGYDDNKFYVISSSFTNYVNNNNFDFIGEVHSIFFSQHKTGRAIYLLREHFAKDEILRDNNIKISCQSPGILFHVNNEYSILIMISQKELPLVSYKKIIKFMKFNIKLPLKKIHTYSWEEVIFNFRKITEKILTNLVES